MTVPDKEMPMRPRSALLNRANASASASVFAAAIGVSVAMGLGVALPALAQSSDAAEQSGDAPALIDVGGVKMTLEELEAYLEKQKAELEAVKENRAAMQTEQDRIRSDLERIEEEQQSAKAALDELCAERAAAGADQTDDSLCE